MRITILGAPMTKKNSPQIISTGPKCTGCGVGACKGCGNRTGRPFLLPSKQSEAWTKNAVGQIASHFIHGGTKPWELPLFTVPVNCRALFFRERAVGDANNFYAALADALEEAKVVENDRLIVSWDGSRMLKDDANPRIEVLLSPVDDAAYSELRRWRPRASQPSLPGLLAAPAPSPLEDDDVPIR